MVSLNVEVYWDAAWVDETAYVREVRTFAGFERPWAAVARTGECVIILDNSTKRFSPDYSSGALYGFLTPGKEVKISAGTNVIWRGYIENLDPVPGVYGSRQTQLTCLDGMAQLAKQQVGVVHEDSKAVDDAVSAVVAAAYTPPGTDYSDNGDVLEHYGQSWTPENTTCLDALRQIAEAVYGRFYLQRDGTATFRTRNLDQNASVVSALVLGADYSDHVLDTQPDHLIAYWPLWESSGSVANDESGNNLDGTVTGATWGADGIGDGRTALRFDGSGDRVNIYSAGLNSAFNGQEGTILLWLRVDSWGADSTHRDPIRIYVDENNLIEFIKNSAGGTLQLLHRMGSYQRYVTISMSGTTWLCVACTWSKSANKFRAYLNGTQTGATQTMDGTWTGSLSSSNCAIGAGNSTASFRPWLGDLGHVAVWDVALDANTILGLVAMSGIATQMSASLAGDELVNAVQVTVYPAETVGVLQDIWQARTTLKVSPGQERVVAALFRDENGERCGAVDVVDPAATTDYTVEDPDGNDFTSSSDFDISFETEATRMLITLGNTYTRPLFVTLLKVRGKPIRVWDPVVIEKEDSTSQSAYFKRARVFDLAMQSDPTFAESLAEYVLDRHADPALAVQRVMFHDLDTLNDVDLWSLALFDLVLVSDVQTGLDLVKHWIRAVQYLLYGGRSVITLHLERADQRQYWLLEVMGFGELGETTVLGF